MLDNQNLTKFLTRAEATKSVKDFFQFLTDASQLDPENFAKYGFKFFDEPYILILGQHAFARAGSRCFMTAFQLKEKVMEQLQNPLVVARILLYQIYMDDDGNIQSVNGMSAHSTIIVEKPYVFVYESGFSYIRLKTVWDLRDGNFMLRPEYDSYVELKEDEFVHRKREGNSIKLDL